MKIGLCHTSVLPRRGGCETYISSLARRLVADGHEVHLFACERDAAALPSKLHFHPISMPGLPRFLRPWWFSRACRKAMDATGLDVSLGFDKIAGVDVYYPQGGMYQASVAMSIGKHRSRLFRALLLTLKWFEPAHLSYLLLEKKQYHRPGSAVIAISDMVRRHLEEHGISGNCVHRVPIAPPRERLLEEDREGRRRRFREKWSLSPGGPVALFVGLNHKLKGLEPLLHALARPGCESIELVVAGSPTNIVLEHLIRRKHLQNRVKFVGYCQDMRDAYFAADFLTHPTFYDPCSNVVLEALACGMPVITSRHNGASELLRPTKEADVFAEGYVIPDPHEHRRLAACLIELLKPERYEACSQAAREAARGWTFEDHYQALMNVLTQVSHAGSAAKIASRQAG